MLDLFPQLALLLQHLELQSLDAVLKRLFPLPYDARLEPGLLAEVGRADLGRAALLAALVFPAAVFAKGLVVFVVVVSVAAVATAAGRQAALLQVGPRLQRLDAPLDAVDVGVGAVEQDGDGGADLVAQGGLGGGEGGLRDELVVLE